MAISKSLSEQTIEEFSSRISADLEIPEALKKQLLTLTTDDKWKTNTTVSDALETFHSISEGEFSDKA